jgi:two-component system KDP operon response regulator KdpE
MINNLKKILVIEDDEITLKLVTTSLEAYKYSFHYARTGEEAIREAVSYDADLIIADLGLPDIDGLEVIRKIRSWSAVPIIVTSARSDYSDKIEALDSGADDYLQKPCHMGELMARIRSNMRQYERASSSRTERTPVFENGDLKINFASGCVYLKGEQVHLTPIEYKLLCLIAENADTVIPYSYILEEIWKNDKSANLQSLRVFMAGLRKKIEPNTAHPKYIKTQTGIGYLMPKL